jgi:spermidine synthase
VVSNGVFLMDTRDGRSERLLVTAALEAAGRVDRVLIGGLGVGFSLATAVADGRVRAVTVVEVEQRIVDWHADRLRRFSAGALDDSRVEVVVDDLTDHVRGAPASYDVICVDIDNGPTWTVTDSNAGLYDDIGTQLLLRALRPGGVLAVWSAQAEPDYEQRLREHECDVTLHTVEVARGEPDVVYVGRRR